jgi:hypothetical protein
MKFLAACVLFFASVQAFAPLGRPFGVRTSVRLFNERPDTSKEVQAALEASKKYGPTSKEARIAWEAVEEMDSADNRYGEIEHGEWLVPGGGDSTIVLVRCIRRFI